MTCRQIVIEVIGAQNDTDALLEADEWRTLEVTGIQRLCRRSTKTWYRLEEEIAKQEEKIKYHKERKARTRLTCDRQVTCRSQVAGSVLDSLAWVHLFSQYVSKDQLKAIRPLTDATQIISRQAALEYLNEQLERQGCFIDRTFDQRDELKEDRDRHMSRASCSFKVEWAQHPQLRKGWRRYKNPYRWGEYRLLPWTSALQKLWDERGRYSCREYLILYLGPSYLCRAWLHL